jgi:hypothetical protein
MCRGRLRLAGKRKGEKEKRDGKREKIRETGRGEKLYLIGRYH